MRLASSDFRSLDLRTEEVDLTDVWHDAPAGEKVTVVVREMSGHDRGIMQERITELHSGGRVSVKMVDQLAIVAKLCTIGEDGAKLFADWDEAELSREVSAAVLSRISEVALRLSGIGSDQAAAAEGNSDAAPSGELSLP
ncbi:MAG TPA: hypothetical protein VFJ14_17925 [Nocardioidaceae bacterium]|nr:hypothetical protein [Nocardioidaceae bacterium]